jgi:hypothetical protein
MEKNTWLNHMREHLPVQYDNIMRMEQMNFWAADFYLISPLIINH